MSLFQGHEDDVFVIECAVFSKNLVVTAGHDGRIKLWDMTSGRTLLDCYNMIDGQVNIQAFHNQSVRVSGRVHCFPLP